MKLAPDNHYRNENPITFKIFVTDYSITEWKIEERPFKAHHTFVFVNIRAVSPRITLTGSLVSSDSWTPTEPVIQVDNTLGTTRSGIKKCLMSLMQPREKGSKNGHPRPCFNKWLKK